MKLYLEWGPLVPLKSGARKNYVYLVDTERLPQAPGVYVFGRRQKNGGFEALYVGRTSNIRNRVRGHRNHLRLMMHQKNAKQGERVVRAGVFVGKPGQNAQKSLPLIERALIQHFLTEGHDLGTR